ncbi:MAG: hypothetical protein V7L04_12770 [Nostoc sp.]|uniref:hypothetical protein n=1 Tax=Nostoc sp. TaxID=1180 RepID=UPI002FFB1982
MSTRGYSVMRLLQMKIRFNSAPLNCSFSGLVRKHPGTNRLITLNKILTINDIDIPGLTING